MEPINIVSVCDGMSCGQIALKQMGVNIGKYYASEIDKFAIKQTMYNFPNTIQLGNMENWREWDIDWTGIDMLIGGTPCQGFSFAGKQLAFNDPRSRLFLIFIDILNYARTINPDIKFFLENVKMKKEHMEVINRLTGIEPILINSSRLSAQNRERYYWTNIKVGFKGLFNDKYVDIPQPDDKHICFYDIMDIDVDEKYYMNDIIIDFDNNDHEIYDVLCGKMVGRRVDDNGIRKDSNKNIPCVQRLEFNTSMKSNCLTTVEKDNLILIGNLRGGKWDNTHEQSGRVYSIIGKMQTLQTHGGGNQHAKTMTNKRVRRLTPNEYSKLQTIPDFYKWVVSDSQIFKMCGNGWTISVIIYLFSFWSKLKYYENII